MELENLENVIIIYDSKVGLLKLKGSLQLSRFSKNTFHQFRKIDDSISFVSQMKKEGKDIDLIISDIFFQGTGTNVLSLIKEVESFRKYWNTPFVVFTNVDEQDILASVRKAFVHLPFRIISTSTDSKEIQDRITFLLDFRSQHRHLLDLEEKVGGVIDMKNERLIASTIDVIDTFHEKFPASCNKSEVERLKGNLYYQFWRQSIEKLQELTQQFISTQSPAIKRKIDQLSGFNDNLRKNCFNAYTSSFKDNQRNWKTLEALYRLYMDNKQYDKAKVALLRLNAIYPKESSYHIKIGKIDELTNRYDESMNRYFKAADSATALGMENITSEDLFEIVDASLDAAKKIMKTLQITDFTATKFSAVSDKGALILKVRKNNAQMRTFLEKMHSKFPDNSDYLNKIAITYRRSGDYITADKYYQKAITCEPTNTIIRINYGMCLASEGHFEKALAAIEKAFKYEMTVDERTMVEKVEVLIKKNDAELIKKMMV